MVRDEKPGRSKMTGNSALNVSFPAMNCRAIFRSPSGTKKIPDCYFSKVFLVTKSRLWNAIQEHGKQGFPCKSRYEAGAS